MPLYSRLLSKILHFPEWCTDKIAQFKRDINIKNLENAAVIGNYFCSREYDPMEGAECRIYNLNSKESVRIGDYVKIRGTLCCNKKGTIEIGDYTLIRTGAFISVDNSVKIGKYCMIGEDVYIYDNNGHPILPALRQMQSERLHTEPIDTYESENSPVIIKDNVAIGMRSIILKGVTIGDGAYIGAGSVVTKNIPPGTIVAGNPAKVVKQIKA